MLKAHYRSHKQASELGGVDRWTNKVLDAHYEEIYEHFQAFAVQIPKIIAAKKRKFDYEYNLAWKMSPSFYVLLIMVGRDSFEVYRIIMMAFCNYLIQQYEND